MSCISADDQRRLVMPDLSHLALPGTRIAVKVTPKASRMRLVMDGAVLRAYVTVAPEDGKANAAVQALLAKALGNRGWCFCAGRHRETSFSRSPERSQPSAIQRIWRAPRAAARVIWRWRSRNRALSASLVSCAQ